MIEDARKENHQVIRINGLEIQRLRGGFLAYVHHRRSLLRRPASSASLPDPVEPPRDVKKEEGMAHVRGEPVEFLYCRKCGTLIQLTPPGRSVRCCNQLMVSLREADPPPAPARDGSSPEHP